MHADRYCNSDHISEGKHFNKWKEISNILVICSQMPNVSSTFYIFCFYFCMVNRQRKGFNSERQFKTGALTIERHLVNIDLKVPLRNEKKVPSIYSAQEWNLQHIFLLLMVQLIFLLFWWDSSQYISSMIQMEKFLSSNDNLILNDRKEII